MSPHVPLLGWTQEFALLREAQGESDALVQLESVAMRAINNQLNASDEEFRVDDESNRNMALRLLHGPEYHQAKANIMGPIQQFLVILDERTDREVKEHATWSKIWIVACVGQIICLGFLSLIAVHLHREITNYEKDQLATKNRELDAQKQVMAFNEHKMQQVAEITHIGYWVWDEIADKSISCSEECARIHGVSIEEFVSTSNSTDHDVNWIHPDDHAYFYETYSKFLEDRAPYEMKYRIVTRDGETRWVRDIVEPEFDSNGDHVRTNGVIQDITERHLVEGMLANARDRAESANQAKSNFLATMGHEIRTPLNGVLGLAQLLTDSSLDPDQRKKVDTILSSGHTLLAIINDVLDMSKIEAGGIELEETAFRLSSLISMIASPFQSLADDKGLILSVTDNVGTNLVVKGDQVRLRQILWNLLSNAIKFTNDGEVALAIENLGESDDWGREGTHQLLRFSVEDTGSGIAQDRLDSIFDAFAQEDNTITRKHGGTGLGLSIARHLADMMGGIVEAESTEGKGSKFSVTLPFGMATAEEIDTIATFSANVYANQSEPLNILLAEDNEVNALVAISFLGKFGHNVRHVENGKQAVEAAKDEWVDLVLMDVHMPEMNGIDATKAIRSLRQTADLPILGLTAEAFSERHAQFTAAGMNGVLTKPFTERQLVEAIDRYRGRDNSVHMVDVHDRDNVSRLDSGHSTENANSEIADPSHCSNLIGDDEKFESFCEKIGLETVSTLLGKAEKSLQINTEGIRQGLMTSNADQVCESAHAIRGSSGSMYAIRISELSAIIEENSSDIAAIRELMPEFEETAKKTIEWWRGKST